MAWFRVDDGFYDHPKVIEAGNAAVGLWVRCGCWSSAKGEDGRVPLRLVRKMGTAAEVAALVDARLWVPTDTGMLIPDFLDYNPSKADNDHRRKVDAERKRRARLAADRDPRNGQFVARGEDPFA